MFLLKGLHLHQKNLVYIDCSELKEEHSVNSKLLGASAGYVGHGERHKFDEVKEHNGNCVVLFDEVEKAHIPAISSILLRVLEEGEIQDSKGFNINFRHATIIFTSNVGSEIYTQQKAVGFQLGTSKEEDVDIKKKILAKVNERFRPEFLNRIGSKIVFNRLTKDDLKRIIENEIQEVVSTLKNDKQINLIIRKKVYDYIVEEADKESQGNLGARPLKRKVSDLIEMPLADIILENENLKSVTIGFIRGKITWKTN
jgi:ATP-dependent Clp protease ATP-binding subunit ClpC